MSSSLDVKEKQYLLWELYKKLEHIDLIKINKKKISDEELKNLETEANKIQCIIEKLTH